jgi:phosphoribosylaminoimidazolecarboxamide formyltransferase/IMP cyclohydrolase
MRIVKKVQDLVPVKTAFISLFNKTQSEQLAEQLFSVCPGLIIFSSGGTYTRLEKFFKGKKEASQLVEVSVYTGLPETEGGLVKTLHHKLFLGYLTETFCISHQEDLKREGAVAIDLVIVDLYPFTEVVVDPKSTPETCRMNIDVGGPCALRAAAKNYLRVMTVAGYSPENYDGLIARLNANRGCTYLAMRLFGFQQTFKYLAEYDAQIAAFAENLTYEVVHNTYEIADTGMD